MSSQPFSPTRDSHRRHSSRRPAERDRDSLSDMGSLADDAGDRHHRRSRSRNRVDGAYGDMYAVVPRRKQRSRSRREDEYEGEDDGGRAVGHVVRRRRSDDSIASSCSGRTEVYDSRGRRQDDRRPRRSRSQYSQHSGHSGRGGHHYYYDDDEDLERKRQQQPPKKRSRLDPRVIIAAVFCVGAAAYCWKEASSDRKRSPRRKE
ncbi:hypothetical protein RB595_001721 [Gaeumannomyces hyphopodioides]